MIAIVDYGLGNIKAFVNVYERLKIKVEVVKDASQLKNATKIILPGVGAFDYTMHQLNKSGMRSILDELVLRHKIPIIGICVGMQMFAKSSEEGMLSGLGYIDATVKRIDIPKFDFKTRLPHMGWNTICPTGNNPLMHNLDNHSKFYFLHSYYFHCNNSEDIIATTEYGATFASAVNFDNVYGTQFHPEKSHQNGIQLLENFGRLENALS